MTTLENFVSPVLTRALGWTLLHSLWQGALVAAVLAGALLLLRRQRAEVRYAASAGALGMVVALAGITFGLYINAPAEKAGWQSPGSVRAALVGPNAWPQAEVSASLTEEEMARMHARIGYDASDVVSVPVATAGGPSTIYSATQAFVHSLNDYLPLLVVAWLLGLLAMSLRMLGGLLYVQRLRGYRVRPLAAAWQERFAALAARSGVRRPVDLLESALVQVPLVVGHWRPVILLPLGAVAGLTPAYLEAILAHELAHVLRRDYLVNLLQTVAEVLFFYHPAVWFVASCVRTERENCCDDQATALVGGDPLRLARALTALAEWTQSAVVPNAPRLAVAAMGQRGALLNRVRRLVQRRPAAPTLAEGLMAGALVVGGLSLLGGSVALAGPLQQPTAPAALDWQISPAQTNASPAGTSDTTKRLSGAAGPPTPAPIATVPALPAPPEPPQEFRHEAAESDGAESADDQPDQAGPHPKRRMRRVIVNGQVVDPGAYPGSAGTVVITKDKKGRVTDLVVNGQRVETETGKGKLNKLKIKSKKDKNDPQVEIIQVAPPMLAMAPDARTFVYRSDDGTRRELERDVQREVTRELRRSLNRRFELADQNVRIANGLRVSPNIQLDRTYRLHTLGTDPDVDTRRAQLEALRGAERGLRTAVTAKGLTTEQRKRINKELENVRTQLRKAEREAAGSSLRKLRNGGEGEEELRDLEQARFDRAQADRDRAQARLDRAQADRDRAQADWDRAQADRDRALVEHDRLLAARDRVRAERDRNRNEDLLREMQKDGLIKDPNHYRLKLTAKRLVIDGKEQPQQVFQKYLKLHESSTGHKLSGDDVMEVTRDSDSSSTSSSDQEGPRPPRPPRAPRTPRAPLTAPSAPPLAPPAPPAPPRYDPETLRSELRQDGLISANDKGFQFQLNNSGLTVNGKKQSDELAAKYRKLTGHADGKEFNMSISSQE